MLFDRLRSLLRRGSFIKKGIRKTGKKRVGRQEERESGSLCHIMFSKWRRISASSPTHYFTLSPVRYCVHSTPAVLIISQLLICLRSRAKEASAEERVGFRSQVGFDLWKYLITGNLTLANVLENVPVRLKLPKIRTFSLNPEHQKKLSWLLQNDANTGFGRSARSRWSARSRRRKCPRGSGCSSW